MEFKKVELPDGGVYKVATDDNCAVVKTKKEQVWLSSQMITWLHQNFVAQSDCEIVVLQMNEVSDLVGKLLTVADASFTDKQQREGVKSLIKQIVWKWGKESHMGVNEQQQAMLEKSELCEGGLSIESQIEHYEE